MKNNYKILLGSLVVIVLIGIISLPSINAYRADATKAKFYQSGIELMRQGKWLEANKVFNEMLPTNPLIHTAYSDEEQKRYKESDILSEYADAKISYDSNRESSWDSLRLFIPENYSGAFASDIKEFRTQLESDPIIQEAIRVEAIRYAKAVNRPLAPSKPRIGMTASEMSASTWGTPKDKNRTTTAYGIREQWVYGSGRYIYLEDGIVTAIQD